MERTPISMYQNTLTFITLIKCAHSAYHLLYMKEVDVCFLKYSGETCKVGQNISLQVNSSHKSVGGTKSVEILCHWTSTHFCLLCQGCQDCWQVSLQVLNCLVLRQPTCVFYFLEMLQKRQNIVIDRK